MEPFVRYSARLYLPYCLLAALCASVEANELNWTKPHYNIEVGLDGGPDFILGIGVDMRNPEERIYAPYTPYKGKNPNNVSELKQLSSVTAASAQSINFTYAETTEISEEAKYLYAYFRASYGLASAQAAKEKTISDRVSSQSVYMLARKEEGTRTLGIAPDWTQYQMESENIDDPAQRLSQFVSDFGSHYVSSITYGYSIVLRATINDRETSSRTNLTAKLKAGLSKLSAGGQLTEDEKKYFNQTSVNITASVLSGGIKPEHKEIILASMEDVGKFLADLRSGAVSIESAPVKAVLTSWWSRLSQFPKTRQSLAPSEAKPIQSQYGVPQGTVIAWIPPSEIIDKADQENWKVLAPEGWNFCNGSLGAPSIGTSFLRGAPNTKSIGLTGGSETHSHGTKVGVADENHNNRLQKDGKDTLPSVNHRHSVEVLEQSNLPPYYQVLWLCRS